MTVCVHACVRAHVVCNQASSTHITSSTVTEEAESWKCWAYFLLFTHGIRMSSIYVSLSLFLFLAVLSSLPSPHNIVKTIYHVFPKLSIPP